MTIDEFSKLELDKETFTDLHQDLMKYNVFKGFIDGYLGLLNRYEKMPEWKLKLIEFFMGGDHLTSYEMFYNYGQRRRDEKPFVQLIEVARV